MRDAMADRDAWRLPQLESPAALADWLCLPSISSLEWLTLPHRRRESGVDHYQRSAIKKRDGSLRWIEAPRPILARVQSRLAESIVTKIGLHESAHGFVHGKCIRSCCACHTNRDIVIRIDLENFFGSISRRRVGGLLQAAGYNEPVAEILSQLCTVPAIVSAGDTRNALRRSRLPQGSPTSPHLANAVAYRLDRRLQGYSHGADAAYTRYADDLIFSGGRSLQRSHRRFAAGVAAIVMDEGFRVNFRKTKSMPRGSRQQVLGIVLNDKLNTPRQQYDTLRAILTNCDRHGIETQNRDNHPAFTESLAGRVAHVASINPGRGLSLQTLLQKIQTSAHTTPPTNLSGDPSA